MHRIKHKIIDAVTLERVVIGVGAIVAYSYVMSKFDYRMVKPIDVTDTHVWFKRFLDGECGVRYAADNT